MFFLQSIYIQFRVDLQQDYGKKGYKMAPTIIFLELAF